MSKPISLVIWLCGWLLAMIYAHDFVSVQLNQNNLQKSAKIQQKQFNHQWDMQSLDEVVLSFRGDWALKGDGVSSESIQPEISLDLQGKWIYPKIQQELHWNIELLPDMYWNTSVLLEFSNQQQGVFYYSPMLSLRTMKQNIDLSSLLWRVQAGKESKLNQHIEASQLNWDQLPAFNALVIRFYLPKKSNLTIKEIKLLQSTVLNQSIADVQPCADSFVKCHITNQQKMTDKSFNQQQAWPEIKFDVWGNFHVVIWLLATLLMLLSGFVLLQRSLPTGLMLLLAAVFGFMVVMSQSWMLTVGDFLKWPLLLFILWVIWAYRKVLKKPASHAVEFWLFSLTLAIIMLAFNHWQLDFISGLPAYFFWALFQQLLLGPVISDYLYQQLNQSKLLTVVMVGVLFSITHVPNHSLMLATLLGGVLWSYSWLKYRNIYANAFSHALLALAFYQIMPEAWLGSARIGVFF